MELHAIRVYFTAILCTFLLLVIKWATPDLVKWEITMRFCIAIWKGPDGYLSVMRRKQCSVFLSCSEKTCRSNIAQYCDTSNTVEFSFYPHAIALWAR
jgi:hypothetical protein